MLSQEHASFANHNGGQLQFDAGGRLYAGLAVSRRSRRAAPRRPHGHPRDTAGNQSRVVRRVRLR